MIINENIFGGSGGLKEGKYPLDMVTITNSSVSGKYFFKKNSANDFSVNSKVYMFINSLNVIEYTGDFYAKDGSSGISKAGTISTINNVSTFNFIQTTNNNASGILFGISNNNYYPLVTDYDFGSIRKSYYEPLGNTNGYSPNISKSTLTGGLEIEKGNGNLLTQKEENLWYIFNAIIINNYSTINNYPLPIRCLEVSK